MSNDIDERIGQAVDHALRDGLKLEFNHNWDLKKSLNRRRRRRQLGGFTGIAAAVAGIIIMVGSNHVQSSKRSLTDQNLAAPHLPPAVQRVLSELSARNYSVQGMSPVYASYPIAVPTGHILSLSGHFQIHGISATSLALEVNQEQQVDQGMLFNQGVPVYSFGTKQRQPISHGTGISSPVLFSTKQGQPIPSAKHVKSAQGRWYPGDGQSLTAFSAAGNHVYVTHGNVWADLKAGKAVTYWAKSPGHSTPGQSDFIAGLPAYPNHALLLEENASGRSMGYTTANGGRSWTPWPLGMQTTSNLIAIGTQYWVIYNGTLATSSSGQNWHIVLPLNTNRWQVESYAVNPTNSRMITVALIPISGDGIGPVLRTTDGGLTWHQIPHFPAIGAAPSSMTMTPNGNIAALVNLDRPVLIRYSARNDRWAILPIPVRRDQYGVGQLSASPSGNLIYGAPGGMLYEWVQGSGQWLKIDPPQGSNPSTAPASPLQAIGDHQILASYNSGWWIYYLTSPTHP